MYVFYVKLRSRHDGGGGGGVDACIFYASCARKSIPPRLILAGACGDRRRMRGNRSHGDGVETLKKQYSLVDLEARQYFFGLELVLARMGDAIEEGKERDEGGG